MVSVDLLVEVDLEVKADVPVKLEVAVDLDVEFVVSNVVLYAVTNAVVVLYTVVVDLEVLLLVS
jgi:hypothetical protein